MSTLDESSGRRAQLSDAKRELLAQRLRGVRGDVATRIPASPDRVGEHPASFGQRRTWFIEQLAPGTSAYGIVSGVRMSGALDRAALDRAIAEVVRRHDVFRTTFRASGAESDDGDVVQVVAESVATAPIVVDLESHDDAERARHLDECIAREADAGFDLVRGPLFRITLVRLSARSHVLLVAMHHIVTDGWSMGIVVRELGALYASFVRGEPSPLADLPVQYADFARWERKEHEGDKAKARLDYWVNALRGAPPVLDLPLAAPRPPTQSMAGATTSGRVSADVLAALKALAHGQDASLFMVLLGALQVLLYRYTGQSDVVVGTPIANRTKRELEGVIGFFANTLALRTDLSGQPTFRDAIQRVKEVALGAYANQDIPFERLVEALQPKRNLQHHPIFQGMFVLQNAPASELALDGLSLQPITLESHTSKFDFTLNAEEDASGLALCLEFATDLFDRATAERMLEHYANLLGAFARHPDAAIDDVSFLGAREEHRLLHEWNETAAPVSPVCLHELFTRQVDATPDARALVFGRETLSYRQLDARANRLAHRLRSLGVESDSPVGLCLERGVDLVVAVLAALKAGGAYLPLDPEYPAERSAIVLEDASPAVVLTTSALASRVASARCPVLLLDAEPSLAEESSERPDTAATPADLAYVLFTSGSTGRPKGVCIEHRAIVNHMEWMLRTFDFGPRDVTLQKTPFGFDASVWEFFAPLLSGGCLVVAEPGRHSDPAYLAETVRAHGVTILQLVPAMLSVLVDEPTWPACTSLRWLFCGGEALARDVASRARATCSARLVNLYGPTEATIDASWHECASDERTPTAPLGRPIANMTMYVVDARGHLAPAGVSGELWIAGAGLARGYAGRAELTRERFVANPFGAGRAYRTGDVVRRHDDGTLEYLGRLDNQVKIRGFRVELGEIEAVLASQPDVRACLVMAREDRPGDKRLVAYVIPTTTEAPDVAVLRDALRRLLPAYMVPSSFVVVPSWPTTANGKVDRAALPAPEAREDAAERPIDPPSTPSEELVASLWRDMLGVALVGRDDDFFALGGHSLLAMRLVSRIRSLTGVDVPLRALFETSTLRGIAERIERRANGAPDPASEGVRSAVVTLRANEGEGPVFCVHPASGNAMVYRALAARWGGQRPLYGLHCPSLERDGALFDEVEAMAAYYVRAIRTVQPGGPYFVAGWSLGGVVAYEIAAQLEAAGERVALTALFDAWAPGGDVDVYADVDDATLLHDLCDDYGLCVPLADLEGKDRLAQIDLVFAAARGHALDGAPPELGTRTIERFLETYRANVQAVRRYVPGRFTGPLTLFRAADDGAGEGELGWDRARGVPCRVLRVPGTHRTLMSEPIVAHVAASLQAAADEASRESHHGRTGS